MNKKSLSSVTIELTKLIDIFKISGHGHVVDRLGFKENDDSGNHYIELSKIIDKLIKTHQEEMIDKLCLENECWEKVNKLSIHNFLNILQAEKLSKMLESTQEEIKKNQILAKPEIQTLNQQDKLRLKQSITKKIQSSCAPSNYLNVTNSFINKDININSINEDELVNIKNENIDNYNNVSSCLNSSKMTVNTGLNSKIYTSSTKSRHMPSAPHVSTENMLSNYIFSGSTTKMNEHQVSTLSPLTNMNMKQDQDSPNKK